MKSALAVLAFAATAIALPQAVTDDLRPKGSPPKGCDATFDGKFEVSIFRTSTPDKREVQSRECNGEGVLVMTLKDGVLKDAHDRTGYISESYQFQFDGPPQSGSIYTAGFSACTNGSLALGTSTVFYQCKSGDFFNLYDRHWAEQCEPIDIVMMPCGGNADKTSKPKRKVVGSKVVATEVVTMVSGGKQRLVTTEIAVPMCQIGDGQVQVRTTPCDNMEMPIITAPPVSQSSDGRLKVPTTAPPAPPPAPPAPAPPVSVETAPQSVASEQKAIVTDAAASPVGTATEAVTEVTLLPVGTDAVVDPGTEAAGSLTVMKFDTSMPTATQRDASGQTGSTNAQDSAAASSPPTSDVMKIHPSSVAFWAGTIAFLLFL